MKDVRHKSGISDYIPRVSALFSEIFWVFIDLLPRVNWTSYMDDLFMYVLIKEGKS